jgi:predicted short-subunit dehydrogenase-like oxidoreductase (DUF2520 family)
LVFDRKGFSLAETKRRIGFIGAGRVGGALAIALREADYPVVAIASRSPESAAGLAALVPGSRAVSPQQVVDASDIVFITTPDSAIRGVCEALGWRPGVGAVHTSGVYSSEVLAAAAAQGAAVGSLHPLQTFADRDQARANLPASVFAVEAQGWLREELLAMVSALGGSAVELTARDKALYHASAVLVSNYTVTLVKMATDLWLRFGVERPAALRALLPLLRGAVNNLEALGLPLALTGPVARGDTETVAAHLEALAKAAPEMLPVYRGLALQTIPIALARGGLDDAAAAELRHLLDRGSDAPTREGEMPAP